VRLRLAKFSSPKVLLSNRLYLPFAICWLYVVHFLSYVCFDHWNYYFISAVLKVGNPRDKEYLDPLPPKDQSWNRPWFVPVRSFQIKCSQNLRISNEKYRSACSPRGGLGSVVWGFGCTQTCTEALLPPSPPPTSGRSPGPGQLHFSLVTELYTLPSPNSGYDTSKDNCVSDFRGSFRAFATVSSMVVANLCLSAQRLTVFSLCCVDLQPWFQATRRPEQSRKTAL